MPEIVHLNPGECGLFGYGSLLLQTSMERTLGRPYARPPHACQLRGWKRTWDCIYPNQRYYFLNTAGKKTYPENILYLNIAPFDTTMNGLVYVIDEADLPGFDKRESVYDRIDIREQLAGIEVRGGPVWAYVAQPAYVLAPPMPVTTAAIRRGYIQIVEDGLAQLGPQFTATYRASTDPVPESNVIDDQMD